MEADNFIHSIAFFTSSVVYTEQFSTVDETDFTVLDPKSDVGIHTN